MLIPLIPKNPELNDFTCRDGEIDFIMESGHSDRWPAGPVASTACDTTSDTGNISYTLAPEGTLTDCASGAAVRMTALHNIRIPLRSGDRTKAELMLSGETSRVDPETADRLTLAIVQKAAEVLLDLSTDLRRQGLFILPFRFYTMQMLPDGTLSYPSPQAVALPSDFPPHPEITAASATDDTLTLSIRFPVRPHRLSITPTAYLPEGCSLRTFISYPLYIPDPKEMRGSIGSVRSATGGNATGIRFAFLSKSSIKASVAAPEKYYEMVGNERTGYRVSSKAAPAPDYSCYADLYGYVPPFPCSSLLALGEGVSADTDPMDWIADWVKATDPLDTTKEGYLPATLPYKYRHESDEADLCWPEGIDADFVGGLADSVGASRILLTRPMTFASDSVSRRHAEGKAIRRMRVLGLAPSEPALAVLYGSDDGVRWEALRRFDPRISSLLLTPPRLFWRLLLMESGHSDRYAVGVVTSTVC